ncbi:nucleotidyltransferase [Bacillus sp. V3B]|uniref:nucleotidyltransferase n=1 Tax=Bacillus sp. V3B TaxID=2804915 RepID=UPI00210E71DE|nr:nucleotidyltransferase [Bacillus sp. V3B]MCQ6273983.1 nucleotidyltransferase [Bacillus sp. V3B]
MKAVGVIVEYNPFHHGHAYHIKKAKEATGADIVIAAMSGNFLQRGEPALVSKWTRTEMALNGGVDLVFELPYSFAVQKADTFANGAVSMLAAAGCDSICFGSESGNIEDFHHTYHFLENHQLQYNQAIRQYIDQGHSYPKALSLAFQSLEPRKNIIDLSMPNNILGFQYVKAAEKQQSSLKMVTITRKSAHYHDEHFTSATIASATSIRKALFSKNNDIATIQSYVADHTYKLLLQYKKNYGIFHDWNLYWPFIKLRLLQISSDELKEIYEVEEGLENRLISLAIKCETFNQFMKELKTKRYTWTRLQRTLTHILTHSKKEKMQMNEEKVSYLRLLGMTEAGRMYLNRLKKDCPLPIIAKRSSFDHQQLAIDTKAARIYAMGIPAQYRQKAIELEFTQQPIYVRN